jgi:predicted nucleotidyltransferase
MIIGGVAVIARGVPRVTRDIDLTVEGGKLELAALVAHFAQHGFAPRITDAVGFATANQVLLLRHTPSRVDIDLSIAWLPFENEAIASADSLELAGTRVPIARAEDLVIYKAIAFRPQDQQDIERLVTLHGDGMDFARVRRIVGQFAEALDEPERSVHFEALLKQLGQ